MTVTRYRFLMNYARIFLLIWLPTASGFAQSSDTNSTGHSDFAAIDAMMERAVADGNIPGGVVLVGHNGKVVYRKAFGSRSLEPGHLPALGGAWS